MLAFFKWLGGLLIGGGLKDILDTIEKGMDNEVTKEEVKADVTKKWIEAQTNLLVGRTWWFQLFFVIPAGIYWSAVITDSIGQFESWDVAKLPEPLDEYFAMIIAALFVVDGGKALLGRFKK